MTILRKTLLALVATATIAGGTVATTASAQAGHKHHHGGVVVKFGHNHHYGQWGGGYGGGYGGCFYKPKLIHTPWGPVWKNKLVCPWY